MKNYRHLTHWLISHTACSSRDTGVGCSCQLPSQILGVGRADVRLDLLDELRPSLALSLAGSFAPPLRPGWRGVLRRTTRCRARTAGRPGERRRRDDLPAALAHGLSRGRSSLLLRRGQLGAHGLRHHARVRAACSILSRARGHYLCGAQRQSQSCSCAGLAAPPRQALFLATSPPSARVCYPDLASSKTLGIRSLGMHSLRRSTA